MNYKRLLLSLMLCVLFFSACNKNHYNLDNVNGAQVEGEMLLPLASASFSVMDMIERLELNDMITIDPSGDMSFDYQFVMEDVLDGSEVLYYHGADFDEHFAYENPVPFVFPIPIDTVIKLEQNVSLNSNHIRVYSAAVKSGTISMDVTSNAAQARHIVLTCSQIKMTNGQDLRFDFYPGQGNTIDLSNCSFEMTEQNSLVFNYDIECSLYGTTSPEITFDSRLMLSELELREISGWIDAFSATSEIDTSFTLFPDYVFGAMEITGAEMTLSMRNGFGMPSRLIIETAQVSGPGIAPYSLFDPMPQTMEIPASSDYVEVFHKTLTGKLNAQGGHVQAVSNFILNPEGMTNLVTVCDTSTLDIKVDARIPLAFKLDEVSYSDTIEMSVSSVELPELIKKLTLELTFISTIPLNMGGTFLMYDSETGSVLDVLVDNPTMIQSTFDGQACTSTVAIELDEAKLENFMRCNALIMNFVVDTDAHDVVLNTNQDMQIFVKSKVEYDGNVELNNEE